MLAKILIIIAVSLVVASTLIPLFVLHEIAGHLTWKDAKRLLSLLILE